MSSIPTFKSTDGGVDFRLMIAEAAYYKAEQRGFAPGNEMDDWLAAERELVSVAGARPKTKRKSAPRVLKKKPAPGKN